MHASQQHGCRWQWSCCAGCAAPIARFAMEAVENLRLCSKPAHTSALRRPGHAHAPQGTPRQCAHSMASRRHVAAVPGCPCPKPTSWKLTRIGTSMYSVWGHDFLCNGAQLYHFTAVSTQLSSLLPPLAMLCQQGMSHHHAVRPALFLPSTTAHKHTRPKRALRHQKGHGARHYRAHKRPCGNISSH